MAKMSEWHKSKMRAVKPPAIDRGVLANVEITRDAG